MDSVERNDAVDRGPFGTLVEEGTEVLDRKGSREDLDDVSPNPIEQREKEDLSHKVEIRRPPREDETEGF